MPINIDGLWLFIPAALALNLTPGPDMLFCLSQGVRSGARAGFAAALGVATGAFIHSLAAGLGLAALIAAQPWLFEIVRWAGVIYLTWLALKAFREPITLTLPSGTASTAVRAWWDGIVVSLLNPKMALFILALVPQFVDAGRGNILLQFLIFGAILNIGGTVVNGIVGGFAGGVGRTLAHNRAIARRLQFLTSVLFLGLAARLAFDKR